MYSSYHVMAHSEGTVLHTHTCMQVCFFVFSFVLLFSVCVYTGCPRRNVPDFGRMFLKLKYTDITQNTYIQS